MIRTAGVYCPRVAAAVCLVAAVACAGTDDPGGGSRDLAEPVPSVMEAEAARSRARPAGHVGVVVRERRVVVPAPFGARLLERFVQPGDEVQEGDPLARFATESVERALAVAEAVVREAEAARSVAEVELEQAEARRSRREGRRELFPAEQLEEVRTAVEVAEARLVSSEARLASARMEAEEAGVELERALLRAPMAGVVDAVYGSPGAQAERGDPVAVVAAGDFHVRFAVPAAEAERLGAGSLVEVRVTQAELLDGVVVYASPDLDPRALLVTFAAVLCGGDLPAGTPVRVVVAERGKRLAPGGSDGCPEPSVQ